ncbi:MAG TPA: EpsI family protein [Rhizomicrobium sp.]|jgi:EpsI family protein|nr:EpsI family protein [Rhizomicrobium sp.]
MTTRRDIIIGAACVLGAGAAALLKPRRYVSLMPPGKKLSDILPLGFEDWKSQDLSDLVAPETPDSLAARLYGETVGRMYQQQSSGHEVFMLMAHGGIQSNELQIHRPEVCYPAFGFTLTESAPLQIPLAGSVLVPGRRLVAYSSQRQETIAYWTRLGETFPTSVQEQRLQRLETAMHHYIPDGLLARFSVVGPDATTGLRVMMQFIPRLVAHVAAGQLGPLIGTSRALLVSQSH